LNGEKRWRETGAEKGDFPLQTAMIGSLKGTMDHKEISGLGLATSLAKVGLGMSSCSCSCSCSRFLPRLQHLRNYFFNRQRRNLQSRKTWSVRLWDIVSPHQFDLISGDRRSRQSFCDETNGMP
jgi:hypothetical protein